MFQRLSRMAAAVTVLSALAVFAWAEGRTPNKNACYEKDGCCADACPKEACANEDGSPACTDACEPCSAASECGTGCAAANKCNSNGCCEPKAESSCCKSVSSGCCKKKADTCAGCCKKTASTGCCESAGCCKTAASTSCCKSAGCCKTAASTGCCKNKADACAGCCKKAASTGCCTKKADACAGCCTAAVPVSEGCCACCKSVAVKVSEACCGCCKKKEAAVSCPSCAAGKACCAVAAKASACCACCKAAAAAVSEACCACCKGECPCSKKAGQAPSNVGSTGDIKINGMPLYANRPGEAGVIMVPMTMMMHHVPTPYFQAPVVPPAVCPTPMPAFDHSTYHMPCPGMPMPCPPHAQTGYVGCPGACPTPHPLAVGFTTASAPKQYEVRVKLIDCKPGRDEHVITMPRITVVEGQAGKCTTGTQGCASSLRVRVDGVSGDKVSVGIRLAKRNTCHESERSVVTCQSCSTMQTVKLDESVRLAVSKHCASTACGKSGKWVEILVKECEAKASMVESDAPPPFFPMCAAHPVAGPLYPSSECIPPMPHSYLSAAATAPEFVRCAATEPKCESRGRVVSIASDGCLQVRNDDCTVRGTSVTMQVKGTTLTLRGDEMKGRKRVCVEADCDLEAVADTMTVASDGRLILEGEVHVLCPSPSSGMAERVEAGRVVLEVESGKIKCIQVVHDKP